MPEREREFSINDFLRLLKHRGLIVFGCAILMGGFLGFVALATAAVYEANGSVQVASQGGGLGLIGEFFTLGGGDSQINSEVEIVRSRSIALAVIDELDLRLDIVDGTYPNPVARAFMFVFADKLQRGLRSLRVDDVEFPPSSVDSRFVLTINDESGNYEISDSFGTIGSGQLGEPFVSESITFTVTDMSGVEGSRFFLTPRGMYDTLEAYNERLVVSMPGGATRTNLIRVVYRSGNPTLSSDVVNAVFNEYEARNIEWKLMQGNVQTEQIEDRLSEATTTLHEAEAALEAYKNEFGVIILPEEARLGVRELAGREAEKVDIALRLSLFRSIHSNLAASIHDDTFAVPPSLTSDPVIQQLSAEHSRLMVELEGLLLDYTENHPSVIGQREAIQQVRENILEAMSATIRGLVSQLNDLSSVVSSLEQTLYDIPGVERELLELTRERDVTDEAYRLLVRRLDEVRLVEGSFLIGNRQIDNAVPPDRPVAPSIKRNIALGLGLGLILGILLAFLIEIFDLYIRRPDQMENLMAGNPLVKVKMQDKGSVLRAASILALAIIKSEKPAVALICPAPESRLSRAFVEKIILQLSRGVHPILLIDTSVDGRDESFFGTGSLPGLHEIAQNDFVNPQMVENGRILVLPPGADPSSSLVANPKVRNRILELQDKTSLTLFYSTNFADDPALRGWSGMSSGAALLVQTARDRQNEVQKVFDALAVDNIPVLAGLFLAR